MEAAPLTEGPRMRRCLAALSCLAASAVLAQPAGPCTERKPPTRPDYEALRNDVTRPMDKKAQLEVLRAMAGSRCLSADQAANLVSYFSGFGSVPDLRIEAAVLLAPRLTDAENLHQVLAALGPGQAAEVNKRLAAQAPTPPPAGSPGPPPSEAEGSADNCYHLAAQRDAWSRTPELLCVSAGEGERYRLSVKTGIPLREVARFDLPLLERARCIDCNKDRFGVPETGSAIGQLTVQFDGKRDTRAGREWGTVQLGSTRLYYRSASRP